AGHGLVDVVDPDNARIRVQLLSSPRLCAKDAAVDAARLLGIASCDDHVVAHVLAHVLHLPAEGLRVEVRGAIPIGRLYLEVHDAIRHESTPLSSLMLVAADQLVAQTRPSEKFRRWPHLPGGRGRRLDALLGGAVARCAGAYPDMESAA